MARKSRKNTPIAVAKPTADCHPKRTFVPYSADT